MKFCQQCGQTISILSTSNSEYCKQCSAVKTKATPMNNQSEQTPEIFSAALSYADGKIILKSKEGWILWSGSAEQEHSLQTIVDRAAPILKIRSKRKK